MHHNKIYDQPRYTISQAADLLNISIPTLRMYEKNFLFIPYQKESRQRLFSEGDLTRIRCIRTAINTKKFSIEAIKLMYSLIPCWDLKNCSAEDRSACPAYNSHGFPCWSFKHEDNLCELENCRECVVYKEYSDCGKIKTGIQKISESV